MFQNAEAVLQGVVKGMELWRKNIFPALFPFFIISHLMIDFGFIEILKEIFKPLMSIFKINPNASFILAMSLLSGSPSNAIYTKELYLTGKLSKEEAEKTLTFTYFSSPLFILGTLSLIYLKNSKLGILIFFIHVLSGISIGLFFRGNTEKQGKMNIKLGIQKMMAISKKTSFTKSITKNIEKSLQTMFLILGSVCFIYIITSSLEPFFIENPYFFTLLKGFLEVTQGLQAVSILPISLFYQGLLSIMMISFGGMSIFIQIISILSDTDLDLKYFFVARIFHAFLAATLFIILFPLI